MNLSHSLVEANMNSSDPEVNSTSGGYLLPAVIPVDDYRQNEIPATTSSSLVLTSNKPCSEAFSSPTPAAVKLPGSLDALLYIVIVLMFYAFSIAVLMVKYIRREREEANLRNYYHEFVSRDKFRTAQYKNTQFMKRIFGKGVAKENHRLSVVEEETWDVSKIQRDNSRHKNQSQTIIRNGNTFNRMAVDEYEEERSPRESFTFLGAKSQFCKNGFFGKKFCNKQLCSKCVSDSVPTIDWGDDPVDNTTEVKDDREWSSTIEVRLFPTEDPPTEGNSYQTCYQPEGSEHSYQFDRGDGTFLPIIECDSDKEGGSAEHSLAVQTVRNSQDILGHSNYTTALENTALVSSCSLEVSELLANMPPLGEVNATNDMDTLDGLSNLDSEADSQSLLNYSASIKGSSSFFGSLKKGNPTMKTKSASGEERRRDLSDFLSERTSLLSCTLSIDDGEEDDVGTNFSSPKHYPNGLSYSNSNGKVKEDFRRNGKSILNALSKSVSSDEEEVMKILNDITLLTEESGVFKNLKYFLRSFSKHENIDFIHEKSNLLPRETYFGPGSPKSYYLDSQNTSTKHYPQNHNLISSYPDMDTIDDDFLTADDCENYGNRWGYTYDQDDELHSDGERSSSFGEYCMGETTQSQVIDTSKPLVRRQLDSVTRDGLSRAFVGINDSWADGFPPTNKPNPMLAGYGSARKETKV